MDRPETDEMIKTLGARLRKARYARGLSQAQLGRLVGSRGGEAVSHHEIGRFVPTTRRVIDYARALGVTTDYLLLGWEGEHSEEV